MSRSCLIPIVLASSLLVLLSAEVAQAAGEQGSIIQTDNLGMNVVTYRFDNKSTETVVDSQTLGEFVGLHYYVLKGLRVGMNVQFSELVSQPSENESRFKTFSLLPQIG